MAGQGRTVFGAGWRGNWPVWVVLAAWAVQGVAYWMVANPPRVRAAAEDGKESHRRLYEVLTNEELERFRAQFRIGRTRRERENVAAR